MDAQAPFSFSFQQDYSVSLETKSWPTVTVIIPTFNCSQSLSMTLDSLISQNYPHIEILAIDASSSDRTVEILHSYEGKIKLSSVPSYNVYQMINQGILMAQGDYINVIFPGDFYIHPHALMDMMQAAYHQNFPELIYCGTLLREGRAPLKFLFRPFSIDLLKRGQQPTCLQGCWFRKEIFKQIGIFRTDFQMRGGFDLLCRISFRPEMRVLGIKRALIDYDLRWVLSGMVVRHFWETGKTLYRYFGLWATAKWLYNQKNGRRFFKLWLRRIHVAFLGK